MLILAINLLALQNGLLSVDPYHLLTLLKQFPTAADYFDGGQHDCQEVLRVLMDLLHDEMVSHGCLVC